jgi:hypothetical protein
MLGLYDGELRRYSPLKSIPPTDIFFAVYFSGKGAL